VTGSVDQKHSSRSLPGVAQAVIIVLLVALAAGVVMFFRDVGATRPANKGDTEFSSQSSRGGQVFVPTPEQWSTLTVEPVDKRVFRPEHVTEGKIAVDEDRSTPIFSPYAGRVTKLLAKPGDTVVRGQPLFVIEATDMVQAQNDFLAAVAGLNKAQSQVALAKTVEKRLHELYESKAIALREWQQAQADLTAAQADLKAAETALEAVRNRLAILGKTDQEITALQNTGRISPETTIPAPIAGTIVQRKVGPGQYVSSASSDPVFVIGDLATVWLIAYVRETSAANVGIGEQVQFTVLAYPNETFRGNISYVAAAMDPNTRRLLVRATIPNPQGLLKPEMFASVTIFTDEGDWSPAVPVESVIYEGDKARVWVARDDKSIELRQVTPGVRQGRLLQVLSGLRVGEKVVTKGSLFIDRAAVGS